MKIDVTKPIMNYDGTPTESKVREIIMISLNVVLPSDENLSITAKTDLYELGKQIATTDILDISPENITVLRSRINSAPLTIGAIAQACKALDTPVTEAE